MRRNQTFDAIITNRSIGVEIETQKERNEFGEEQFYLRSKVKKIISHVESEESEFNDGLWTLKIAKVQELTGSVIDIKFQSVRNYLLKTIIRVKLETIDLLV